MPLPDACCEVVYAPTKVRNFKQITTAEKLENVLKGCLCTYKGKKF